MTNYPQSDLGQTYFYAAYNFCAYLNSFANPIIHLVCGNTFKAELLKMKDSVALQLRSAMTQSEQEQSRNQHRYGKNQSLGNK